MELTLLTTIDTIKLSKCFSNNEGNVVDSKHALETCVSTRTSRHNIILEGKREKALHFWSFV